MSENIIMLKFFMTAFSTLLIVARYKLDDYSLMRLSIDGLIALMLICYIWSVA